MNMRYSLIHICSNRAQSEQVIAQLEATIESAKAQYNELMETAIAYRDEAIKWRSKFI